MDIEEIRATYNKIAEDYTKDHRNDTWDDDYIELFAQSLEKDASVLDLGCGPGADTAKLAGYGLVIEGFDLSDSLLAIAGQANPSVQFTQGDMRKLPYADNRFNGVFAKASLLHIPKNDIPLVIQEIRRVLKPNGKVHIALKGGTGEGNLIENDFGYEFSRFFSYWKLDDFTKVLTELGFKVLQNDLYRRTETSYTIWLKYLAEKV